MGNVVKSCRPDDEDAVQPPPSGLATQMHWSVVPETFVRAAALAYITVGVVVLAILGTVYGLSLERNVRLWTNPMLASYNPSLVGTGSRPL